MYERMTDRARKVCQLASMYAQRVGHNTLDAFHLLYGLRKEGTGIGGHVLQELDVPLQAIENRHNSMRPFSEHPLSAAESTLLNVSSSIVAGKMPHSRQFDDVIAKAIVEAKQFKHSYVGTEHFLLALLSDADTYSFLSGYQKDPPELSIRSMVEELLFPNKEGAERFQTNDVVLQVTSKECSALTLSRQLSQVLNQIQIEQKYLSDAERALGAQRTSLDKLRQQASEMREQMLNILSPAQNIY